MIKLNINGKEQSWDGDPDLPLLWFLRDEAGLTGTKFGCGQALCGACTVIIDKAGRALLHHLGLRRRRPARSPPSKACIPTGDHPVQKAWRQVNVPQCGFCQAGQIMQAAALLTETRTLPRPDPRSDGGQHLPLRLLPAHRERRASRIDGSVTMNIITNPDKLRGFERHIVKVENVSRRSILKGLGIAGGFVLAAPVMSRPAFAYETGAGKMPHGVVVDPRVFVAIAPDGTVTIVAHRSEMGTGVRTSLPLIVAEEMEADWKRVKVAAGPWRRSQIRQPGHRRIAQHATLSDPDAPDRRLGARHAGSRRRQALGRAGRRGEGRQSRGRPRARADAVSALAISRPMPRRNRCRPSKPEAEGPEGLPLSRQGRGQHRRSPRHHHRARAIRRRRPPARHEICRHRPSAGDRRQAGVVRRARCDESVRRREGDGGARAGPGPRNSSRSAASP